MSIRCIRNVVVDGEKSTIEIQIGHKRIGDKCYVRVNNETEQWFENTSTSREDIISEGIDLLQEKLGDKTVTYPDGRAYDWN